MFLTAVLDSTLISECRGAARGCEHSVGPLAWRLYQRAGINDNAKLLSCSL